MLNAGISLLDSLAALANQQQYPALQQLLTQLQQQIKQGNSFSNAVEQQHSYFDTLTCRLISAGEQSGNLEKMLQRAADYRQHSETLKQRIRSACLYPAIVLTTATVVTLILLLVVVPQFCQLFADNHIALPQLTQQIINLSQQLHHHYKTLLLLPLSLLTMKFVSPHSHHLNQFHDWLLLKLPVVGNIIKKRIIVRCLETLATTFSAGIPLLEGLAMSAAVANNDCFYRALMAIETSVAKGQSLHQAIQQSTLFSPLVVEMVACGERSGQLDKLIMHLTTYYRQQIDHFIANLNTLLEPVIMVILGGVIGFILVAIYLPIFQLGKVI